MNTVCVVQRDIPAAWLPTTGAKSTTATESSAAAGTWGASRGACGSAWASGCSCTGRAAKRPSGGWRSANATRNIKAPTDALRCFAVEIDGALVNTYQAAIYIAHNAAGEGGFDFWREQRECGGRIAAVVFEITKLKCEILDEFRCPVGVQDKIAALFADKGMVPASDHVNEQAFPAGKIIGGNIGCNQSRVAELANSRRVFVASNRRLKGQVAGRGPPQASAII